MTRIRNSLLIVFLVLFGFCDKDDNHTQPAIIGTLVETSEGLVQGAYEGNHLVFNGIPYAAAPVGNLRWMPPQEPPKHSGILNALAFCPACPQPKYPGITTTSEDCLFLMSAKEEANGLFQKVILHERHCFQRRRSEFLA